VLRWKRNKYANLSGFFAIRHGCWIAKPNKHKFNKKNQKVSKNKLDVILFMSSIKIFVQNWSQRTILSTNSNKNIDSEWFALIGISILLFQQRHQQQLAFVIILPKWRGSQANDWD